MNECEFQLLKLQMLSNRKHNTFLLTTACLENNLNKNRLLTVKFVEIKLAPAVVLIFYFLDYFSRK